MPILKMRKLNPRKVKENPEQYKSNSAGFKRKQIKESFIREKKRTEIEEWDAKGIPEKRTIIQKGKKITEIYDTKGRIDTTRITKKRSEKVKTHRARKMLRKITEKKS